MAGRQNALKQRLQGILIYRKRLSGSLTFSNGGGYFQINCSGSVSGHVSVSGALTNITASVTGKTLTITWPADQLGWILQAQTNHSDSGQWFDLPCSSNASSVPTVMDSAAPAVFYRLSQS